MSTSNDAPAVTLRPLQLDDAAPLAALYAENREFLAPFEPIRPAAFFTPAGQTTRIAKLLDVRESERGESWIIAVDGELGGMINVQGIVRGPFQSGNLGYWVAQRFNGRGVATAAAQQVLVESFGPLGLHRLQAGTLIHNSASQKVLAHNGFSYIGTAPRYLQINGVWSDHMLFQRLNE